MAEEWKAFEELCRTIPCIGNSSKYLSVDFHLHTPASGSDYKYGGADALEKIVQKIQEAELDAVFVTDHNEWQGIKALREKSKTASRPFEVYPGIELSVEVPALLIPSRGKKDEDKVKDIFLHCLALLPPEDDFDNRLKDIVTNGFKDNDILRKSPVERVLSIKIKDIAKKVSEWGGILIPAHINQGKRPETTRSFDEIYSNKNALELLNECFGAVEIRKPDSARFFSGDHTEAGEKIPEKTCVLGSDAHHHDEIGKEKNYLLVEKNDFRCIKESLGFRERIYYSKPALPGDRLEEIVVQGAFLQQFHYKFDPYFNSFIGTKGSGKTSILECIRFALGASPIGDMTAYLQHILGPSGRVWLSVKNHHGDRFLFIRGRQDQQPAVLNASGDRVERDAVIPSNFGVDIKGWGEVAKLAENKDAQKALLEIYDKKNAIKMASEKISQIQNGLRSKQSSMRKQLDALLVIKKDLDELKIKKGRLEKLTTTKMIDEQKEKEKRDAEIEAYALLNESIGKSNKNARSPVTVEMKAVMGSFKERHKSGELDLDVSSRIEKEIQALEAAGEDVRGKWVGQLERAQSEIMAGTEALKKKYAPQEEEYQKKVTSLDPNEQEVLMARTEIAKDLIRLPTLESQFGTALKELREQMEEYSKNLKAIGEEVVKRDAARKEVVRELTEKLEAARVETRIVLRALKSNKNTRKVQADEVFPAIAKEFENVKEEEFSSGMKFGLLSESREEYDLNVDNDVDIEFKLYSGEPGIWRKIEQLSAGQKSTAILPLVVIIGAGPVLLDQPEDNLDNKYIGTTVVPMLLREKMRRQFFITSHNATIVVMADSNNVTEMVDIQNKGQVAKCGFLNGPGSEIKQSILDVLDGGEVALRRRFRRYGLYEASSLSISVQN